MLTNRKEQQRKGKIQLIDARQFFVKMHKSLGNKRNKIGDPGRRERAGPDRRDRAHPRQFPGRRDAHLHDGRTSEKTLVVSKIFDNADFGFHKITVERPLRLNFQASAERIARLDDETGFQEPRHQQQEE